MASERPLRSILKSSSSFDQPEHHHDPDGKKEMKWDEMNILATYHPEDKDYGHKKIDEPPTPYNYDRVTEEDGEGESGKSADETEELDPLNLASKLAASKDPKGSSPPNMEDDDDEDEEDDKQLTEEEKAKQKIFESKRKFHYNEFQAVKLARQLMEEDDDEDDEEEENKGSPSK